MLIALSFVAFAAMIASWLAVPEKKLAPAETSIAPVGAAAAD